MMNLGPTRDRIRRLKLRRDKIDKEIATCERVIERAKNDKREPVEGGPMDVPWNMDYDTQNE